MFSLKRRSSFDSSLPTTPVAVYLKRHIRKSKYDPVKDKVDFVHATPNYAVVPLPSGRKTTVSLRDIAPCITENDDFVYDDELLDESDFVNQNDNTARNPIVMPGVAENDEGKEAQTGSNEQSNLSVEVEPLSNHKQLPHVDSAQTLRSSRVKKSGR